MTREEVIQGLQFTMEMFLFDPSTGETLTEPRNNLDKATIDACKGAIELLKQQPCEDCISRQYLIERATSWDKHFADSERCVSLTDIQNAPSVTPQPKRGKWIEVEVHNCHATLKCSECDRVIEPTYTFGEYSYEAIKEFYPYCHCGAKMDADMREVQT